MKNKIYAVIEANPDGDSYGIFQKLEDAEKEFKNKTNKDIVWGESTIYLIDIKDPSDFGFSSRGEVYGGEVIKVSNQEI